MKKEVTNEQILQVMETRFDGVDKRFDGVDKRLDGVDKRLDKLETKVDSIAEDLEDLAMITKIEFDELDRKFAVLHLRTSGFRSWN